MRFVLDLFYLAGYTLALPVLLYRALKSRSTAGLAARFGSIDAPSGAVWIHGSSVGEVRLIETLVRGLRERGLDLIISSHTATGVSSARHAYPDHCVIRSPLDFSWVQGRLIRRLEPRLIVIVESDFWPNQLLAAERFGVPVAVINGRLSDRSYRLHRWSRLLPRVLRNVAVIGAQSETYAERFIGLGIGPERVVVTGNMKYDLTAAADSGGQRAALRRRLGFADNDCVIIGGSLHPGEDQELVSAFAAVRRSGEASRLVIVPRYPHQAETVARNLKQSGFPAVMRSGLEADPDRAVEPDQVVVVDTLGELMAFYAASDIAFVGGSLYYRGSNKGGHNLMEPAILGLPVLFGPFNYSFRETVADLLAADAGIMVRDRDELAAALTELVADPVRRRTIGARGRQVVIDGQGASERNLGLLLDFLGEGRLQRGGAASTMPPPASISNSE